MIKKYSETNEHENHRQRMLDKFIANPDLFNDHEVLEIILYSVVPRRDTNALAHRILSYFGDINRVFSADVDSLLNVRGVGPRVACHIKSIGVAFDKIKHLRDKTPLKFNSFHDISPFFKKHFDNENSEKFSLAFFNDNNEFLSFYDFPSNCIEKVSVSKSDIVEVLSVVKPDSAVIAHNHLVGEAVPSESDDRATFEINMILTLMNVQLKDHIIFAKDGTYSYSTSGRLQHIRDNGHVDSLIKKYMENLSPEK